MPAARILFLQSSNPRSLFAAQRMSARLFEARDLSQYGGGFFF
jgi:hypothetical protein